MPELERQLAALATERDAIAIEDEAAVTEYHEMRTQLNLLSVDLRAIVMQPE